MWRALGVAALPILRLHTAKRSHISAALAYHTLLQQRKQPTPALLPLNSRVLCAFKIGSTLQPHRIRNTLKSHRIGSVLQPLCTYLQPTHSRQLRYFSSRRQRGRIDWSDWRIYVYGAAIVGTLAIALFFIIGFTFVGVIVVAVAALLFMCRKYIIELVRRFRGKIAPGSHVSRTHPFSSNTSPFGRPTTPYGENDSSAEPWRGDDGAEDAVARVLEDSELRLRHNRAAIR
jgi:hypothetical protein